MPSDNPRACSWLTPASPDGPGSSTGSGLVTRWRRATSMTHLRDFQLLLLDARLAQKSRRFFRWRGIDVEAGAPLESRCLGQLGNDFEMPMVVVVGVVFD